MVSPAPAAAGRPLVTIVLPHRERFGPDEAGAVASVVHRLVTNGSRYDALVVGPRFRGQAFPGTTFLPVTTPRWLPLKPTQSYALMVALALAKLSPSPIEVHNKPDVAALLARVFPNRPVRLFLHNDPRSMRGARTARARERLLRRLDRIVVVSDYLRRALLEGVEATSGCAPMVLHNVLGASELPVPTPMAERDRLLLFAGRVVPEKAPDAFVAACARALPRLPGWRAEMIGGDGFGPGSDDSRFIRQLRPAAGAAGVLMRGYRPHQDILQAMSRAAIAVVPSRWPEPFGLTALEALACGAALACSGRGGLSEVTGECCVPIDPDDIAGFADDLVKLAQDEPWRERLSDAGMARARDHFAVANAIDRLDEMRGRVA